MNECGTRIREVAQRVCITRYGMRLRPVATNPRVTRMDKASNNYGRSFVACDAVEPPIRSWNYTIVPQPPHVGSP